MQLREINVRDPFLFIENGKTYLYRTLSQSYKEGGEVGFCVFVSEDGEYFTKKRFLRRAAIFGRAVIFRRPSCIK